MKKWLSDSLPSWASFQIKDAGKYLGFMMGPGANESQWSAPLVKCKSRAAAIAETRSAASVSAHLYNTRALPCLSFKAQLVPLPPTFKRAETTTLHHLLHMATNSMDASSPFRLFEVGGPKIMSGLALCAASLMRTALKTLPRWRIQRNKLETAAEEHLRLALWTQGIRWPSCWDSPAFAYNLNWADQGFPGVPALRAGAANARACIHNKHKTASMMTLKVQNIVTQFIVDVVYPNTLKNLFSKRLSTLFPECDGRIKDLDWRPIFDSMKLLAPHCAMCIVKTFLNAWTTSRRFHEDVAMPCLFGCRVKRDELEHYIVCARLWKAIAARTEGPIACDTLDQLSISAPSSRNQGNLAVAFTVYHAVKHGEMHLVRQALSNSSFVELAVCVKAHADVAARAFNRAP